MLSEIETKPTKINISISMGGSPYSFHRPSQRIFGIFPKLSPLFQFFFSNKDHHHVSPLARISLTLSCHPSLLSIASGRSSGIHPVSAQSSCINILAGRPAFARPCEGVHRSTSLMSSSLLPQKCLECLVCLTWIVFAMGGRLPYSFCFVGCCLQDIFNIAHSILL